jgi:hypothetical protein
MEASKACAVLSVNVSDENSQSNAMELTMEYAKALQCRIQAWNLVV